jgi:hypothetical protein
MKILSVGTELLHADRWTDRYDEANNSFSQFCEKHPEKIPLHSHKEYIPLYRKIYGVIILKQITCESIF